MHLNAKVVCKLIYPLVGVDVCNSYLAADSTGSSLLHHFPTTSCHRRTSTNEDRLSTKPMASAKPSKVYTREDVSKVGNSCLAH
jgi:hypothetical protein